MISVEENVGIIVRWSYVITAVSVVIEVEVVVMVGKKIACLT